MVVLHWGWAPDGWWGHSSLLARWGENRRVRVLRSKVSPPDVAISPKRSKYYTYRWWNVCKLPFSRQVNSLKHKCANVWWWASSVKTQSPSTRQRHAAAAVIPAWGVGSFIVANLNCLVGSLFFSKGPWNKHKSIKKMFAIFLQDTQVSWNTLLVYYTWKEKIMWILWNRQLRNTA